VTGLDLSTAAGALRFCELRRNEMVGAFEQQGRFEANGYSFDAWVFATHEVIGPDKPGADPSAWKTGRKLAAVKAKQLTLPKWFESVGPDLAKDIYSEALKGYAKLSRAIGTVFMTEMWMVSMTATEGAPDPRADAQRQRDALPDSLEHAPGRREGLCLWLEHSAAGSCQWLAEIQRDPTRLGAWQELRLEGAEGRFVNLTEFRS
jgi:hypothetical protein